MIDYEKLSYEVGATEEILCKLLFPSQKIGLCLEDLYVKEVYRE